MHISGKLFIEYSIWLQFISELMSSKLWGKCPFNSEVNFSRKAFGIKTSFKLLFFLKIFAMPLRPGIKMWCRTSITYKTIPVATWTLWCINLEKYQDGFCFYQLRKTIIRYEKTGYNINVMNLPLDPYVARGRREGACTTARMRKLAWVFDVRLCEKYPFHMGWLIQPLWELSGEPPLQHFLWTMYNFKSLDILKELLF